MKADSDFPGTGLEEMVQTSKPACAVTAKEMFLLPHVQVSVLALDEPVPLYRDGTPGVRPFAVTQAVQQTLASRNWRKLLTRILNLDFGDSEQLTAWLNEAGYIPRLAGRGGEEDLSAGSAIRIPYPAEEFQQAETVNAIAYRGQVPTPANSVDAVEFNGSAWDAKYLLPSLTAWLQEQRDVLAYLMSLEPKRFRKAIAAAHRFHEHRRNVFSARLDAVFENRQVRIWRDPDADLRQALGIPKNLNLKILVDFLTGAGAAPVLHAWFRWDETGRPRVTVPTESPMQALALLVHLDKNFAGRKWVKCANCGQQFEQAKSTDRYHSRQCKNRAGTVSLRRKIKLLDEAEAAWDSRPTGERRRHERVEWISIWIAREWKRRFQDNIEIEPAWVRKQLSKARSTRTLIRRQRP